MTHYYHQGFVLIALFSVEATLCAAQLQVTYSPKITAQVAVAPIPPMFDASGSPIELSGPVSKAAALHIIADQKKDEGLAASAASPLTSPSCSPLLSPSSPSPAASPESSPDQNKGREQKKAPRFGGLPSSAFAGCLAHGRFAEEPGARLKGYTSSSGDVYP